eukprot:TRINITY_DN4672_c0_g1_i1.p1 TRINITY_DN4672_c0_g1~~TRINITY_DN4672_c0_g1_i1.p1  ORF type:complete len:898 (-),score=221.47 TRINITY_DN4672_c0_g1_i1:166-2859(-)
MLPFGKKGPDSAPVAATAYVEVSSSDSDPEGSLAKTSPGAPSASSSSASLAATLRSTSGTSAWTAGSSVDDDGTGDGDGDASFGDGAGLPVLNAAVGRLRVAAAAAGVNLPQSGGPPPRGPPGQQSASIPTAPGLSAAAAAPGAADSSSALPLAWDAATPASGTPRACRLGQSWSSGELEIGSPTGSCSRPSPPAPPLLSVREVPSANVSCLELLPPVNADARLGEGWDDPVPPPAAHVPLGLLIDAKVSAPEVVPPVRPSATTGRGAGARMLSPPSTSTTPTDSSRPSSTKAGSYSIGGGFRKGWKALKKGGLAMGAPRSVGSMVTGRRASPAPLPVLPGDFVGEGVAGSSCDREAGVNGNGHSRSCSPTPRRSASEVACEDDADDAACRLAASLEVERKQARLTTAWQAEILPSWPKRRASRRVRDLVFQGVPASVRGRAWPLALGNSLDISVQLFDILKEQAATGREDYLRSREATSLAASLAFASSCEGASATNARPLSRPDDGQRGDGAASCGDGVPTADVLLVGLPPPPSAIMPDGSVSADDGKPRAISCSPDPDKSLTSTVGLQPQERSTPLPADAEVLLSRERSAHKAIMLDLPRTFPDLAFFHQPGSAFEGSLREILEAFAYLRPDIGYSQGMSFLGAVLLLYLDTPVAFACFVNMLHQSCFLHFFRMKMPEVRIYMRVHERLLGEALPDLAAHLRAEQVEPEMYLVNWVMALYLRALPLEHATRIWDAYMLDGDVVIFRAALGILKLLAPRLLSLPFEGCAYLLSHLPADEIDPDVLMDSVRSVTICTRTHFAEVFRSCEKAEHTASAAAAAKLSPTGRASPVAGSSRDDGLGVGGRNEATVSSAAGGVGGGGGGGGIGGSGTGGSGSVSGALGSAAKAARARRAGG